MQVLTIQDHRYQVEQSASLTNCWKVSSCAAENITVADGVFVSNSDMTKVNVPSSADEGQVFFLIHDLSLN